MAREPKLLQKITEKISGRAPASFESAKKRWKWGNGEVAARIAGTTDKKSREYKNAIRRVQRAAKAGKMTPEIKKVLKGEASKRSWNRIRRHGVSKLTIKSGSYWVSNADRLNKKFGDGFRALDPIGGAQFAPVVEALEAARIAEMTGDSAEAAAQLDNANALLEEIASEAYGMAGGQVAHFTEVGDIEITIR
ncbi:hypothetical protein OG590_40525 (plasmid) [Streptomyces goshikiensis]|uniref:hypothetical protein n=1 Tax=Streptomyces goshikiensis TaxID=1942 RepID=UPI002F915C9E|nr:hypothetical protein OG590_40525 [Streptomyces goshikiensis]